MTEIETKVWRVRTRFMIRIVKILRLVWDAVVGWEECFSLIVVITDTTSPNQAWAMISQ